MVKEAGYEAAFTVYGQRISHSAPPSDILGRYAVTQTNPKIFQDALTMQGGGAGGPLPTNPSVAQLASTVDDHPAHAGRDDHEPEAR